jgi:hypothetical protein
MEPKSNRLLLNLVDDPAAKRTARGKVNFIAAMQQLGIASVFDIIGHSKPEFIERLGDICDADGTAAYDNAMCYAVQIGRLFREQQVSSGRYQDLTQRTGVRALTEIGPSYPNLFKENWDEFCKVGALAAVDSPVAYLRSLYYFATRILETSGQGTHPKILLNTRRPDLARLLIDQQSTFAARPMLEQVNEVLKDDIKRYSPGIPGTDQAIYELLADRRHPFIFPYNFPHHQCRLGLAEKNWRLGELNYRISRELPATLGGRNTYGAVQNARLEAQRMLSGLSPQQQALLIEPSLFTTFYLSRAELTGKTIWAGPGTSHLSPHKALGVGFLLHLGQAAIKEVDPIAHLLSGYSTPYTDVWVEFSKPGESVKREEKFQLSSGSAANSYRVKLNHLISSTRSDSRVPCIQSAENTPSPEGPGYSASFIITTTTRFSSIPISLAALSVTLTLDGKITGSAEQQAFFRRSYGLGSQADRGDEVLIELKVFMQQTELSAEQVEALLSQRKHFPRLSPNCPSTNLEKDGGGVGARYPHANHYGACYVNGHGSSRYDSVLPATTASIRRDQVDNSMGFREVQGSGRTVWYLTKTSAQRFDRLQRMIRLQRWLDIPFAELDTLIISAIRSEGEDNLGMDLNLNTLRALGVYRYLSGRYRIKPQEFAAFMHDLTSYTSGEGMALFDQVFNPVALFDTPLMLDQKPFSVPGLDAASKKTVAQLCAGLGLQPTESSLFRLCAQTARYVGPLQRDLQTVSSLYRQARMAQIFGLSSQDGWALLDMLGGMDYQRSLCTGRLAAPIAQSLKPVVVKAVDSVNGVSIRLTLVAVVEEPGELLRLLPGSELVVEAGTDFEASGTARVFTLTRQPAATDVPQFLKNADGSLLTLAELRAGQSISLSNRQIMRVAWEAITQLPGQISYLRVKCGSLANRDLRITDIAHGDLVTQSPDILDVLMQMDWAVTWLKDSRQSVTQVRQILGLTPGDYLPPEGLTDRLAKLAEEVRAVLVTDQQIQVLNLPTHEKSTKSRGPGDVIQWRTVLLPLLDPEGLVKALPLEMVDNTQAQLQAALEEALKPLAMDSDARAASLEKLGTLLLNGHDRQLRLIEGLAQEMINLPMDRTAVVVHWAQTTVYQLLSRVLQLGTHADAAPSLIEHLRAVLRHAQAVLHLGLSTSALRLFLARPQWLTGTDSRELSWASLYLLGRYTQWFKRQSQAEEALLGYFINANPPPAGLKNKALRSAVNEQSAEVLANLLGWHTEDIRRLFQELPMGRATSMAEVDWVLRCQSDCVASGFSASDLLAFTALHVDSASTAWQAAGEAAVAASR